MKTNHIIGLICLGAIWGSSFIFMRVLAPVLGPIATADFRVLLGGATLLIYYLIVGFNAEWRSNWRHYLVIGVLNSAIPFSLFSFAALHIPAAGWPTFQVGSCVAPLFCPAHLKSGAPVHLPTVPVGYRRKMDSGCRSGSGMTRSIGLCLRRVFC